MCSSPSTPAIQATQPAPVVAPTYADASVTKASAAKRNNLSSLAGRDVRTSVRGLADEATTEKKNVLGA